MEEPTRLSDWPWVVVNVECRICPRRGRYRLTRLAAKFGPEAALDDVLASLAADCHLHRPDARPRAYEARCGIRFADLWASGRPPPDVPPGAPALRVVGARGQSFSRS